MAQLNRTSQSSQGANANQPITNGLGPPQCDVWPLRYLRDYGLLFSTHPAVYYHSTHHHREAADPNSGCWSIFVSILLRLNHDADELEEASEADQREDGYDGDDEAEKGLIYHPGDDGYQADDEADDNDSDNDNDDISDVDNDIRSTVFRAAPSTVSSAAFLGDD